MAYVAALEEEKLPYFLSEFEENTTNFGGLEMQVETFIENLIFNTEHGCVEAEIGSRHEPDR